MSKIYDITYTLEGTQHIVEVMASSARQARQEWERRVPWATVQDVKRIKHGASVAEQIVEGLEDYVETLKKGGE